MSDKKRVIKSDNSALETPKEKCEGCEAPATKHDAEGVPLCDEDFQSLVDEAKAGD